MGSLSRKGAVVFITERVKRLGLPFIAWYVFLGPVLLITLELKMMLFGMDNPFDGYSEHWVMGGPPWFIGILLLFNVTYTAIRSEECHVPLPPVGLMLFAGFVVQVLYSVVCLEASCNSSHVRLGDGRPQRWRLPDRRLHLYRLGLPKVPE